MNRFYCASCDVAGDKIIISDAGQLHHLKDVLRFKSGDKAAIFDDKGNDYSVKLKNISEKQAEFLVLEKKINSKTPKTRIIIACAIPKRSKIDDIIDKLTQLGVDRIIPLLTERVIVKIDPAKALQLGKRWGKIALAASKQSQRSSVPVIDPVMDFADLIAQAGEFDLKLIPNLESDRQRLKDVLSAAKPQSALVLIGPEGDFSPGEIAAARQAGFIPVTFGNSVLRVETACLYIASILNYEIS